MSFQGTCDEQERIMGIMAAKKRTSGVPSPKQLKSLREQLGLTQEDMAAEFNVPRRTYQEWELGRATPPGPVAVVYEILLSRTHSK